MTRPLSRFALPLALPVTMAVVWWFASSGSTSVYYPPLRDDVRAFADAWIFDQVDSDLVPSMIRFATGFGIAVVLGITIGTALGISARARRAFSPVTEFFRAMPIAALVPAGLIMLGAGASMEVALIAFGSTWPILLSTTDGVRATDPAMVEMGRSYGLSRAARVRRVIIPSALPQVFAGLRIALALALQIMIIANMLSGTNGLGYVVLEAQRTFNIPGMWAGILVLALLGLAVNLVFVAVERRMLAWHRGWRAAELRND